MKEYLQIVNNILENGIWKENRTGVRALTCPNLIFSHNMEEGYPLLTTKKMAVKAMAVELEGFIKGVTSKRWFQDRDSNIWNFWGNPKVIKRKSETAYYTSEFLKDKDFQKNAQLIEDDLGPLGYSWQWRRFNEVYDENDGGNLKGYDQLADIVEKLKTNPNDRRMYCSSVNPLQRDAMALEPCHLLWTLTHINGTLHMSWIQRSVDTMLGLPFNIASYALLLTLLCQYGFRPGTLTGLLCDCHIYENHIKGAYTQLDRMPHRLPKLEIDNTNFDIFNWTHENMKLIDYNCEPAIKFPIAV